MYDSALQDFLDRFGDPDPNKFMTQNQKPKLPENLTKNNQTSPLPINATQRDNWAPVSEMASKGLTETFNPESILQSNATEAMAGVDVTKGATSGISAMDVGGGLLEAAPSVMGLISNAKGGQFDTSAEGGGPGKAGGAIMMGATQGAQAGKAIGNLFGPVGGQIGQGVGLIAGGTISALAHGQAQRDYKDNVVDLNLKQDTLERAKNEEEYAMSKGLLSMQNLKKLRERQLGILS